MGAAVVEPAAERGNIQIEVAGYPWDTSRNGAAFDRREHREVHGCAAAEDLAAMVPAAERREHQDWMKFDTDRMEPQWSRR
jgi:hypothetical protein